MLANKFNRGLSFLLTVIMLFTLAPVHAYAVDAENSNMHTEDNSLIAEYQSEINRIMNEYGITDEMTGEEIQAVIDGEDFDYLYALYEVTELERAIIESVDSGELTDADETTLADANATFCIFAQALEDKYGADNSVALFTTSTTISGLTISDTASNLVVEGTSLTAQTDNGSWISKKNNTVTITNTSGNAGVLSLHYEATNYNSFTIAGESASASGDYSAELAADGSVKFYIQSTSSGYATLKLSGIVLSNPNASYNVTFSYDNTIGSVSVGGEAISPNTVKSISGAGVVVTATPISGYSFLGWVNTATNELLSTSANFSLKANAEMTVKAVFTNASLNAWFAVGSILFDDLNSAITYATTAANKMIVLAANGRLPSGSYTIPDGVTLLIPYNTDYTCKTAPNVLGAHTTPSAFRTLTMADGASITVKDGGSINVASEVSATGQNAGSWNGTPTGPHGRIDMKDGSSITLESGANLYAYGYIAGAGNILAGSGSTVHECFQIRDWRGGSATCGSTTNAARGKLNSVFTDYDIFPVNQCYVQNIEAKLTIEGGATEKIFAAANAASVTPSTTTTFIGSGGMFAPASGKSVTKYYSASDDRLILEIDGDADLSSMAISFYIILGTMDLNTASFVFPVPNNMTIKINSGTTTVSQDIAFVPGVEMVINEGATLILDEGKRAYIYDKAEWGAYAADSLQLVPIGYSAANGTTTKRNNDSLVDAKIDVNGDVIINGNAYTTKSGANITSSKGTGKVTINAVGTETNTYQATQTGTTMAKVDIPLTATQLKNADGSYLQSVADTYTYDKEAGAWRCTNTHAYDEGKITTKATCTANGEKTITCSVCNHSYTEAIEATGHTDTAPADHACDVCNETVSECSDGENTDNVCDVCGKNLCSHDQTIVYVDAAAPTCTEAGVLAHYKCTQCEAQFSDAEGTTPVTAEELADPATGHTEETMTGKAATCTETGLTDGVKCSVCSETITAQEEIPALGHTYGDTEYKWTEDYSTCSATRTCTVCTEETEGHTETAEATIASEDTTPATCKVAGVRTYTATFNDATWAAQQTATEEIAIDETAHAWDNDCDTECNNGCGTTREASHDYESVVTEPTCTSGGFTTHTCSVCGHSYTDNQTSAKGCSYSDEWKTDADKHWHVCSVCGEESEKTAHTDGNNDHKCDTCEYVMSECSFTMQGDLKTAGTCMAEAVYQAKCAVCGAVSETETIKGEKDSTNHTGNNTVTGAKDATCTEAGYTGDTVCECGVTVKTGEAIPVKDHNYGETSYTWDDDGKSCTAKRTCANDASHVEEAAATITSKITTPASCTAMGTTTYTATFGVEWAVEQTTTRQDVAVIAHTYDQQKTEDTYKKSDATCTAAAVYYYSCSCGAKGTDTFEYGDKLAHSYGKPQFTWNGYECSAVVKCSCGDEQNVDVTVTSEVTTTATCTVEGVKTYTATTVYNGTTYVSDEHPTEKLGLNSENHVNKTEHEQTDATCTEPGYTAGTYCNDCKTWISGHEVINALEHSWTVSYEWSENGKSCTATRACGNDASHNVTETVTASGAVKTAATCQAMGWTTYTADFEAEWAETQVKDVQDIAQLQHSYTGEIKSDGDGKDATHSFKCVNGCNEYGGAVAHTWNAGEQTKAPACEAAGEMTYTCTVEGCGATYTEEIAANGHTYGTEWKHDETNHWHECSCGAKSDEAAHTYTSEVTKAATCVAKGEETGTCSCGAETTREIEIDSNAHSLVNVEAKAATCTEPGWDAYEYCDREGCEHTTYVEKAALGHSYGTPAYQWTEANGGYTVTATVSCSCDYEVTETVTATYAVTTQPTTETEGVGTYTATFKNELFSVQTKLVDIPKVEIKLPTVNVTNPANNKTVTADIAEAVNGGYTLTVTCEDTTKTYVYLVKYTDADNNVSEKIVNTSGKYSDGYFAIFENAVSVTVKSALLGDVNRDGVVDAFDAAAVLRISAGLEEVEELQILAAETVADGAIDAFDAAKILRVSAGIDSGF